MTQFIFTVGDWSMDGHNMSNDYVIETTFDFSEVRAAHNRMNTSFPQFQHWFEDYEDSKIDAEDYEALIAIDSKFEKYFDYVEGDDEAYFDGDSEDYADLWIDLVTHFTPDIDLKRIRPPSLNTIHGGGYGLYGF